MTRKISFVFAAVFCVISAYWMPCGAAAEPQRVFNLCDQPPAESKITQILKKWRDRIKPELNAAAVNQIEKNVSSVPIEAPQGKPLFDLGISEDKQEKGFEARPTANRRDWAYALAGAGSSMLGCSFDGYDKHMDIAFWCFLEAGLLHPEPDHLSNAAFYLLEMNELVDAQALLCHAYLKAPNNYGVLCNLAHLLALKGDFNQAAESQKRALSGNPQNKLIQEKLRAYASRAGVEVQIPKSTDQPSDSKPPGGSQQSSQAFPADYVPSEVFPGLQQKVFMIQMTNYQENIFGKWSDQVWNPIHEQRDSTSSQNRHAHRVARNSQQYERCLEGCRRQYKGLSPELFECQCSCRVQQCRADLNSAKQYFSEAAHAYRRYRTEAHGDNEKALEKMAALVNAHIDDIYPEEARFIGTLIQDSYLNNYEFIEKSHEKLEYIWQEVEMLQDNLIAAMDGCNRQRAAMQPLMKPEDLFGKPPTVIEIKRNPGPYFHGTFWFWFGSVAMAPDGTFSASLSPTKQAVSLKAKYNPDKNEWGAGLALGVSSSKYGKAGKLLDAVSSAEYTFFFDSKKGLVSDFTAELRPKIGMWSGDHPKYTVKIYH